MEDTFIHYGSTDFDPKLFHPVKNFCEYSNKPLHDTGFWATPIVTENGWRDWCEGNEWRTNGSYLSRFFVFHLRPSAKVLKIENNDDVTKFLNSKYQKRFWNSIGSYARDIAPDFEKLSKDFDALYARIFENKDLRSGTYWQLYGWDVDSILIFNPSIIEKIGDSNERSGRE